MSSDLLLLDTNVLSELWKPNPDASVVAWIKTHNWLLPVVVIAEIQEGAEAAPSQTEKARIIGYLDAWLFQNSMLVAAWDTETARTWGRSQRYPKAKHQPQALWDSLIDAMAVRHGGTIATRNTQDFHLAKTVNPWDVPKPPPQSEQPSS